LQGAPTSRDPGPTATVYFVVIGMNRSRMVNSPIVRYSHDTVDQSPAFYPRRYFSFNSATSKIHHHWKVPSAWKTMRRFQTKSAGVLCTFEVISFERPGIRNRLTSPPNSSVRKEECTYRPKNLGASFVARIMPDRSCMGDKVEEKECNDVVPARRCTHNLVGPLYFRRLRGGGR
jgi:hypothetical protein